MSARPADWIEPSLANAAPIKPERFNGRDSYVVHGIARVYSLAEALELLDAEAVELAA